VSWLSEWWDLYAAHSDKVNPLAAGLGGAALVWAAIQQARTATRRHHEQTRADQQRRVTESFSKAVEQLASEKMEARLGGIYTLERLAIEAIAQVRPLPWRRRLLRPPSRNHTPPADPLIDLYWTVMETLTGFVRERTRPEAERLVKPLDQRIAKQAFLLWENAGKPEGRSDEFWAEAVEQEKYGEPPATDIAAVLAVIVRRPAEGQAREELRGWRFDLRATDLCGANLTGARLADATLFGTHLDRSDLRGAHLTGATLWGAHLADANLTRAHLDRADLRETHLDRAFFRDAPLAGTHLEGIDLRRAYLHDQDLSRAFGDAKTRLPPGIARPERWPPEKLEPDAA
jgi:hypothetical protein